MTAVINRVHPEAEIVRVGYDEESAVDYGQGDTFTWNSEASIFAGQTVNDIL